MSCRWFEHRNVLYAKNDKKVASIPIRDMNPKSRLLPRGLYANLPHSYSTPAISAH